MLWFKIWLSICSKNTSNERSCSQTFAATSAGSRPLWFLWRPWITERCYAPLGNASSQRLRWTLAWATSAICSQQFCRCSLHSVQKRLIESCSRREAGGQKCWQAVIMLLTAQLLVAAALFGTDVCFYGSWLAHLTQLECVQCLSVRYL